MSTPWRCREQTGGAQPLIVATTAMHCDEDPETNRRRLASLVRAIKAESPETRLILFGELCLGWFWQGERRGRSYDDITAESLDYHQRIAEPIPGPTTEFVGRLAQQHDAYIAFGMGERVDGAPSESKPYNAMVLVDPAEPSSPSVGNCASRAACSSHPASSRPSQTSMASAPSC